MRLRVYGRLLRPTTLSIAGFQIPEDISLPCIIWNDMDRCNLHRILFYSIRNRRVVIHEKTFVPSIPRELAFHVKTFVFIFKKFEIASIRLECISKSWIPYIPKPRNQVYLVVCRCVLVCTYGFDASHVPELSRVLSSLGELQLDADTGGDSSLCVSNRGTIYRMYRDGQQNRMQYRDYSSVLKLSWIIFDAFDQSSRDPRLCYKISELDTHVEFQRLRNIKTK